MDERYAIVVARFYAELADRLVTSARRTFESDGAHEIDIFDVPGAFELPLAALYAAQSGRYAGVACLGAIIRGETDHYDYVCTECARGIQEVQLSAGRSVLVWRAGTTMDLAYAAADTVLCRGGMMTCSERFPVGGLPAVYVPLPIGNGEQRLNAHQVVRAGGGLMVGDEELTSAWLTANLLQLFADREKLDEMGQGRRGVRAAGGDEALVDLVYEAVRAGVAEGREKEVTVDRGGGA